MEAPADWPFPDDPPNVAVITTRGVMDGTDWIALAALDAEEHDWQFIGPNGAHDEEAMVVALRRVYERDPSIAEVADLPPGWKAWRVAADAPWQRGKA